MYNVEHPIFKEKRSFCASASVSRKDAKRVLTDFCQTIEFVNSLAAGHSCLPVGRQALVAIVVYDLYAIHLKLSTSKFGVRYLHQYHSSTRPLPMANSQKPTALDKSVT